MSKAETSRRNQGISDLSFSDSPNQAQKTKRKKKKKPKDMPDENYLDKLMKKADSLVETFQYDLAREFYKRVLECDPDNLPGLEKLSTVYLQLGEDDLAEKCLLRAVQLEPERGYRKYFALGQVTAGKDSLASYNKGIQVWTAEGELPGGASVFSALQDDVRERQIDLSNVYCAMAELFMTDLCDEEDAEGQCLTYVQRAIEADESNPESHQCLASFHLVKGEMEGAKAAMEKSLSLWFPKYKLDREKGNENCVLTYNVRTETSKILIELEMFEEATDILDGLLEEDDQQIEVWYLLGLANFFRGSDYRGNSRYYLQKALKICKKQHLETEHCSQVEHMNQMLSELGSDSDDEDENVNGNVEMENENDDDDEQYETLSEDEEDAQS